MKNKSIDPVTLRQSQEGLIQLAELLGSLATAPSEVKPDLSAIPVGGIHGSKIHGGPITNFSSTGIKDSSTRLVVLVNDDGIVTDQIDVETLVGNTNVSGDLTVDGNIHAKKLFVEELAGDLRNSTSESLEFREVDGSVYNKGLLWTGSGPTKQFILRNNPDRLWSSVSIEVSKDAAYFAGGEPVISLTGLGSSVVESSLRTVGVLRSLSVNGDVTFGDGFYFKAGEDRLGLGTATPKGNFSVAGWASEFIVDVDGTETRLGAFSSSNLEIITDNTARITISNTGKVEFGVKGSNSADVSVHGKLGIGVSSVGDDVSLATSGAVRFEGKKFAVADGIPTDGTWKKGDIIWNSDPKPTGFVGWVCTKAGQPGEWKQFGSIAS
jgi:hypothetical protein